MAKNNKVNMVSMDRLAKVFTLTSSSNLQLRVKGQWRSKFDTVWNENNNVNLLIMDRQTKLSSVTLWFDLPLSVKGHVKCHYCIGQMLTSKRNFVWFLLLLLMYLYQSVYLLGLKVTQHDGGTVRPVLVCFCFCFFGFF